MMQFFISNTKRFSAAGAASFIVHTGCVAMALAWAGNATAVVTVYPQARNGRLTALGVTSAKRLASAPDIPAIAGTVKGYEADNWSGLVAPAGTPKDIIAKLQATVVETLKSPEVAKRFALEGGEPSPSRTPEEFGAMMRSEVQKWARVVKTAGIKAQ